MGLRGRLVSWDSLSEEGCSSTPFFYLSLNQGKFPWEHRGASAGTLQGSREEKWFVNEHLKQKTLLFLKPMSIKYQWEALSWQLGLCIRLAGILSQSLTDEKWDLENLGLSEPTQNSSACHFKPNSNLPELEIKESAYRKIKEVWKRLLEASRNLYKASSVMIYMQMNTNVLGIHYVGFSRFDQIQTDHRERNPQTRATKRDWRKDSLPIPGLWQRRDEREHNFIQSLKDNYCSQGYSLRPEMTQEVSGSHKMPSGCKCVLKKTWAGLPHTPKCPGAIVSFSVSWGPHYFIMSF